MFRTTSIQLDLEGEIMGVSLLPKAGRDRYANRQDRRAGKAATKQAAATHHGDIEEDWSDGYELDIDEDIFDDTLVN